MKYRKQIESLLAYRSNNNIQTGFALVAGLAVGAALGVLFAPSSGKKLRKGIASGADGLAGNIKDSYSSLRSRFGHVNGQDLVEEVTHEDHHAKQNGSVKRPKSDIKQLIHEAHSSDQQASENEN